MLLSRKREPSNVSKARHGAAKGLERAAAAVDVDEVEETTPKRRRRKPLVFVALAAAGAWLVAQSRRSNGASDVPESAS